MKKKLLTLLLTLSLLLGLSVPAAAAGSGLDNFKKTVTYGNQFTDVAATYWAAPSIKSCYEYGLMQGYDGDSFVPKGNLTVAQAIVMADRVHEIYTTGQSTLTNGTPWYQTYVDYALENGIIQAGDFANYNAQVTRAQMAYIFFNALPAGALPAINDIQAVPDVSSAHPYAAKILALYQAGVLTGSDSYGTFKPNDNILRAEAAAIIARVALPAQRQSVSLVKDYEWDGVTVPLPTDIVVEDSTSDLLVLQSAATGTVAIFSRETSVAYSDTDITILDPNQMNQVIQEGIAEEGVTIGDLSSQLVTFGAVKAYRTTGTLTMDGEPMNAGIYTYITDDTMYMICLLGQNDTVLKNMADGLMVDGVAAKKVTVSTSTGTTSKPETTTKPSTSTSTSNGNTTNTGSSSTSTVKPDQNTVYVTPTGKRYHYSKDCAGKNGTAATLQQAQARGLTPCAKCAQ